MRAVITFLVIMISISCDKQISISCDNPELVLLNPQNEYYGRIDSITFNWMSSEVKPKNLVIRSGESFENIHLDTIINSDSFIAIKFRPGEEYFWSVSTDKCESSTTFTTNDPLDGIESQYEVETLKYHFMSGYPPGDTTIFLDTVRLVKENNKLRVQYNLGRINDLCDFFRYRIDLEAYKYEYIAGFGDYTYVTIYPKIREIDVWSRKGGGLGGGTITKTRFPY